MINIFLRLTTLPALCQSRQWRWFSFFQLSQNYLFAKKSQVNIEALLVQNESFRCRSWRSGRGRVAVEDGGARGRRTMRIWRRRRTKMSRRNTMSMKETLASLRFGKEIVLEWGISSQGRERGWWERESEESGSAGLGWRVQSLPEGRGLTNCNLLKYCNVPSRRSSRC